MKKIIGYIGSTHGLDGKIKIISNVLNEDFEFYIKNNEIFLNQNNLEKPINIKIDAFNGKSFICKIDGIDDIEHAKFILKHDIFVYIEDNEKYINPEDILNFEVFVENIDVKYGKIIDFGDYGNGNLIEVKLYSNGKSEFYRCDYNDIIKIDTLKKTIFIKQRVEC